MAAAGWAISFFTGALLSGAWLYIGPSRDALPASALKVVLLLVLGGGLSTFGELISANFVRALLRAAFLPWLFLILPWAVTFGSALHAPISRVSIVYWTTATACVAVLLAVVMPREIRAGEADRLAT